MQATDPKYQWQHIMTDSSACNDSIS